MAQDNAGGAFSSGDLPIDDSQSEGIVGMLGQEMASELEGDEAAPDPNDGQELGTPGGPPEGINVDLNAMTDEELADFAVEHPEALRSQALMQARFTDGTTRQAENQARMDAEREALAAREAGVLQLLQRAGSEVSGEPQTPLQAAMGGGVAPQSPQAQPGTPATPPPAIGDATNLAEFADTIEQRVTQNIHAQLGPFVQQQQETQVALLRQDVDAGFAELARAYPDTATPTGEIKPEIRAQITEEMLATSNPNPEVAYVKAVLVPQLRERQQQMLSKKKQDRSAKPPMAKPTTTQTRGKKLLTPEAKRAATLAYAAKHPDAFT